MNKSFQPAPLVTYGYIVGSLGGGGVGRLSSAEKTGTLTVTTKIGDLKRF